MERGCGHYRSGYRRGLSGFSLVQRGCTDVIIVEREDAPGYHTSGRSAAVLSQLDVDEIFMKTQHHQYPLLLLTARGLRRMCLSSIRTGFSWSARGLHSSFARGVARLSRRLGIDSQEWSPEETVTKLPALERDFIDGGVFITKDGTLDVHALLWGFLKARREAGAGWS